MTHPLSVRTRAILLLAGLVAGPVVAHAQKREPALPLSTSTLGGQTVSVLPLTMVVADSAVTADTALYAPYRDRRTTLLWADSLLGEMLTSRAPEVKWVLPPALRKSARRNAGFIPDPDQMGQAVMRSHGMKQIPDPLRSSLRSVVAIAGGRYALIPAALVFSHDTSGAVRADFALAFGDARTGTVLWHSLATGLGAKPGAALLAALDTILPPDTALK